MIDRADVWYHKIHISKIKEFGVAPWTYFYSSFKKWSKNWLEFDWVKNLIKFCRLSIDSKHKGLTLMIWFGPQSLRRDRLWSVEVDCMHSCRDSTKRTETRTAGFIQGGLSPYCLSRTWQWELTLIGKGQTTQKCKIYFVYQCGWTKVVIMGRINP